MIQPKFVALMWSTDICLPVLVLFVADVLSLCVCELICKPITLCVYNMHAWGCVWEHCVQGMQCLSEKWLCVCLSECIFFSTICMPVCLHQSPHVCCILYIQACPLCVCLCVRVCVCVCSYLIIFLKYCFFFFKVTYCQKHWLAAPLLILLHILT